MSGPTAGSAETLTEAMREHRIRDSGHGIECSCGGWRLTYPEVNYPEEQHRAHAAAALLASDWMKRHDAEVRAEALRKAADALIPFPDNDYGAFPWGAQKWLRDRAALAEEGER